MAISLLALLHNIAAVLDDVAVRAGVAARKTAGVLGDDLAVNAEKLAGVQRRLGRGILRAARDLMKTQSVVGMIAMFLAGGGILVHGIPAMHHGIEHLGEVLRSLPAAEALVSMLANALIGVLAGALLFALLALVQGFGARLS